MKQMRGRLSGFVVGVLVTALVMTTVPAALAAARRQSIDVVYSDIKMVVDGRQVTPTDVNGNVVEPFAYQGTTYLPVRAAVNAITGGTKAVEWEQETSTIYIGERLAQELVDMADMLVYPENYQRFLRNQSFVCRQETYNPFNMMVGSGTYLLGGKYETLQGSFAIKDDAINTDDTLRIYAGSKNDLGELLAEYPLEKADEPIDISVNVSGLDQIYIEVSKGAGVFYNATLTPVQQG